jgi:DNA helicase II / ATP-dependent DNA helicase PcrA
MNLSKETLEQEDKYLQTCLNEIGVKIKDLSSGLQVEETNINEFRKYMWENKGSMDPVEIRSNLMSSELELYFFSTKADYLKKLYRIKNNPYFGRIDFKDEDDHIVYIGITHLLKGDDNLIYDWRAPISSLFYDYELGEASYKAPEKDIKGILTKKRQYKIKDGKLIHIFDNDINVTDDFLQEVLANTSTDKMKNIVNTIQKEQNEIIRNTDNKHLIVQGIAGSGKTSVALHRIAFLLYKTENLLANNILIFSPNNIFSEYISNVLPELGEANALETTFSDFALKYISGYRDIEDFPSFVERYYTNTNVDKDLTKFKLSNNMINILNRYVDDLIIKVRFKENIKINIVEYSKELLTDLFHNRFSKFNLFDRVSNIAEYIVNREGKKNGNVKKTIETKLWNNLNVSKDLKKVFKNFFKSNIFIKEYQQELSDIKINSFINNKILYYEDSLLLIYLQGLLKGFPYSSSIKQIVIDEAQDYSKLQYIILKKIFPKASFTILGDVNQNINPYYKYYSLKELMEILDNDVKYLELNKTYRSSAEIIDFSNEILGLEYAVSVRHDNNIPVIKEITNDPYEDLKDDIVAAKKIYKKIAIITKNKEETDMLYQLLKKDFKELNNFDKKEENYNHDLVIIPSYLSKGLEFDFVIVYTDINNKYNGDEKHLYYVVATRAQHQLKIYNQ